MEIEIRQFLWQTSVWVGGFQQSGPLVENLWRKALKGLTLKGETFINVLILGLGCGSAIKPLRKKFPNCQITGVEINPEMIEIGKKYFNLNKISNSKIICTDAKKFVSQTKQKFNLVLVDIYFGGQRQRIKISQRILSKNGLVIFNELKNNKNKFIFSPPPFPKAFCT